MVNSIRSSLKVSEGCVKYLQHKSLLKILEYMNTDQYMTSSCPTNYSMWTSFRVCNSVAHGKYTRRKGTPNLGICTEKKAVILKCQTAIDAHVICQVNLPHDSQRLEAINIVHDVGPSIHKKFEATSMKIGLFFLANPKSKKSQRSKV